MPNLRRGRGIVTSRGPRRQTDWANSADQSYVVVATNANVIHQSFPILSGEKWTIVRTRGELSVIPTDPSVNVKIVGALGMCIVSDQAFAAGAGSIPGPITNGDWDGWFVWVPFHSNLDITTDIGRVLAQVNVPFDSKAMRKVTDGDTVVVMVESQVGALSIAATFRMLFKLA